MNRHRTGFVLLNLPMNRFYKFTLDHRGEIEAAIQRRMEQRRQSDGGS